VTRRRSSRKTPGEVSRDLLEVGRWQREHLRQLLHLDRRSLAEQPQEGQGGPLQKGIELGHRCGVARSKRVDPVAVGPCSPPFRSRGFGRMAPACAGSHGEPGLRASDRRPPVPGPSSEKSLRTSSLLFAAMSRRSSTGLSVQGPRWEGVLDVSR
jgi:hypothetical protein